MKRLWFLSLWGWAFALPMIAEAQQGGLEHRSGTSRDGYGLLLPQLTLSQELAFLHHAEEKTRDFFDYLSIAGNPEWETEMRKQAGERALEMFSEPDANVRWDKSLPEGKSYKDAESLVNWALAQEKKAMVWDIQSAKASAAAPPSTHRIVSQGVWNCPPCNNAAMPIEIELEVEFRQVVKQFGSQSERVWEVFFTAIHFRTPQ